MPMPKPKPKPMLISPVKPPASRRKPAPTKPNLKPNPQPNPQAGRLLETARGAKRAEECAGTI